MDSLIETLSAIADAVKKAVDLIPTLEERGKDVEMGADGTPTSEVDKIAENTVLDYIVRNNVPLNVLSEEIGYVDNGFDDLPDYYDTSLEASTTFGVFSYPTTVVVSADGEILTISAGRIDPILMRGSLEQLV